MSICIGITSYMPDNVAVRKERINRLTNLINHCNDHFKLDILIIAQNWKDDVNLYFERSAFIEYHDNPLGITPARNALRDKFLKSDYDYMIMMDDDTVLSDDQKDYDDYLGVINSTGYEFYWLTNFYIRLCCISKKGFSKIQFDPKVNAEDGTGWEDVVFNKKCKKLLSSREITCGITPLKRSEYCDDTNSTWDCFNKTLQSKNGSSTRLQTGRINQVKNTTIGMF